MKFLRNVRKAALKLGELRASLQSYYRGSSNRDQREFYDLESALPYFDNVNRILCRHKRQVLLSFLQGCRSQSMLRPTVLEVGCGVGYFARILARQGYHVAGIDISPRKIQKAVQASRREGPGEVETAFRIADIRLLGEDQELELWLSEQAGPGASGRFRSVVAADVLEHVPEEPRRTLASLRSRILPEGQLLASVPSRLCVRDPGHVWRFLPDDWARIFEDSGFSIRAREVSRICWYGIPTPLPLAEVFDLRPSGN